MKIRRKIACWLVNIAKRLEPEKEFSLADIYEPKKLGIGYHITKKDIKDYRKKNPSCKSHREALNSLIEDTKREIGMNIFAGVYKNGIFDYTVKKSLYSADVSGRLFVYVKKEN